MPKLWLLLVPSVACIASGSEKPKIAHIGLVAPDIIGITVHCGRVEYGRQVPYEPQPGDKVDRKTHQRWVRRDGEFLGSLAAIRREADERVAQSDKTGFRWTKDPWRPIGWGLPAAPDAVTLCRAHALTGEAKYLRTAILACQFGAGANPSNLCYTTGLGHASPQHPLHIDSRITHQPPPPGLTVFGPADVERNKGQWGQKLVNQFAHPKVEQWPSLEAFFDVFWYPPMCEFTIHQPMAANAYVWGYLAARQ